MTGRIVDTSKDIKTNKVRITLALELGNAEILDELLDKNLSIELKPYKPRRSRDANAYAWVLMGKLAAKIGCTPTEIYQQLIQDIGDNYDIVCIKDKAVDKLRSSWSRQGKGWITETMPSKIKGCTNVVLYYGSSVYTTEQMSRLIDCIQREAKLQNIETATPEEIALMKENWK